MTRASRLHRVGALGFERVDGQKAERTFRVAIANSVCGISARYGGTHLAVKVLCSHQRRVGSQQTIVAKAQT